ncbi:DUF1524 domain-containing protein [Bifidobacterium sp. ESL0745]|uniref:GmrSD restriction endonuclease domain-containing protein n=1 Tax=Bifidobacterium sp. ESL0745 TaxID=2983226 RepID=UPI0023F8FCBF|nr:DUF1524 domain-containing protein [Bifidobacterium sp. ESL0745]MDF7666188.1 DUF1524 domain-containing protein [Bifidobacterium sp. ESL0745]
MAVVTTSDSALADTPAADSELATAALDKLPVKGRAPKTGYKRTKFSKAWADVDRNGCDTRNDILRRDLKDKKFKAGTNDCKVMSGTLDDPYTGKTIHFKQGKKTSSKVQIDHVVALSNAWQTGAQKLTADQRKQMANDPYNLLAVDGKANQQKSDGDAATWLPKQKSYRCAYVSRQIGVKTKYDLWVTKAEKAAMQHVLASCPTQVVPVDDGPFALNGVGLQSGVRTGAVPQSSGNSGQASGSNAGSIQPVPVPVPVAASKSSSAPAKRTRTKRTHVKRAHAKPAPAPVAPAPAPAASAVPQGGGDVYYKNCAAVRAAGKAPIYAGQPGYRAALDRDRDGIACEK